ncbi:MAG: DNA/RNA non-specific endonuclease, partial [Polyangia bacterium]
SHWKPQVNDEVSPFEGINPALREQVWDGGKKTQAGQAMFTAFDARLKLGEDEEHDWYRPQNRKEVAVAGGGTRITYSNSKGADFEIDVGADGMIESITGSHLTLKEPGSRGATGQAGRAVPNEKIESCHLIADQFRGSGYKSSANLIAASQTYNQQEMKGAETTIANFIKNMKATEFDMTVGVKWMDVDVTKAVAALEKRYPDVMKPKLKAKIQQELTDFITRMKSASPNLKRVKETKYTVKVKDPKGVEIPMDPAPKLGMDIWLGTSSAPAG